MRFCCRCARAMAEVVSSIAALESIPRDLPEGSHGFMLQSLRRSLTSRSNQWLSGLHKDCGFTEQETEALRSQLRGGKYNDLMDTLNQVVIECAEEELEPPTAWR